MSWGERSCIYLRREDRPCKIEFGYCNVSCKFYTWDGKTSPDSIPNHGIDNMLDLYKDLIWPKRKQRKTLKKVKKLLKKHGKGDKK